MTESEFVEFAKDAVPAYAADKVASGQWAEAESLELSRNGFAKLLPQGLATPDNYLFTVRDEENNVSVGILWIAVQERAGKRIAYVYDVSIKPGHRRKGHAARAFLELEALVRARGLSGIALSVMGHNAAAHLLYEKLGYRPTITEMFKPVDSHVPNLSLNPDASPAALARRPLGAG
jgi:ribosomal protein S18 acetylase RimI-like enzyme